VPLGESRGISWEKVPALEGIYHPFF